MSAGHEVIEASHSYRRGAKIFRIAAESFGITITPEQVTEWQYLLKAAYVLDNFLDSGLSQPTREARYDEHVSAMFQTPSDGLGETDNEMLFSNIRDLAAQWQSQKVERIISATTHIKEIAAAKRETKSAKRLGKLALYEGTETARFLGLDRPAGNGVENFNQWLEVLLRFGVVVDSAIDLPQDYDNQLTQVNPTKRHRLIIASCGAPLVSQLITRTPSRLYKPLLAAARAVTDDTGKDLTIRAYDSTIAINHHRPL